MPAKIHDKDWCRPEHYTVSDSGCWNWNGPKSRCGYGKATRGGHSVAHRVYYSILVGPIPAGLEIDHLCKNRACVNPSHLQPVTHAENVRRGDYKSNHRNGRKSHCARGHEFTTQNTRLRPSSSGVARKCRTCTNQTAMDRYYRAHRRLRVTT